MFTCLHNLPPGKIPAKFVSRLDLHSVAWIDQLRNKNDRFARSGRLVADLENSFGLDRSHPSGQRIGQDGDTVGQIPDSGNGLDYGSRDLHDWIALERVNRKRGWTCFQQGGSEPIERRRPWEHQERCVRHLALVSELEPVQKI